MKSVLVLGLMLIGRSVLASDSLFFSTLTSRDGLPSNFITSVTQDSYGFIWVATPSGLARYDGQQFTVFKQEAFAALPNNKVSSLLIDGDILWVGTSKGLCTINVRNFVISRVNIGKNSVVRTLYKDRKGTIWIGTATGLIAYHKGALVEYNTSNSNLSHNMIRALYEDIYGNLWVGTHDKLNRLSPGDNTFHQYDLNNPLLKNNLILDIKYASDSSLWVGTDTGLTLLHISTGACTYFTEKTNGFSNGVIKCIYPDGKGRLWLGTDFGLNIFNPSTGKTFSEFHNLQVPYSLADNVIWQIFEDTSGVIWLVTSNGLSRIDKHRNYYEFIEVSPEINGQKAGNQVKALLVTQNGVQWLGTLYGVIRIDPLT
jgi:ligand-binding sensor domain-containing protein